VENISRRVTSPGALKNTKGKKDQARKFFGGDEGPAYLWEKKQGGGHREKADVGKGERVQNAKIKKKNCEEQ